MVLVELSKLSIEEKLEACAKCGKCRSICPVFKETQDELLVTRGKLALLQSTLKGDLNASTKLRTALDTCLMCLKCRAECPSLVQTDELICAAREQLNQQKGLPLSLKFTFRFIIPHRWLYDFTIKALSFITKFKSVAQVRHIPLVFANPMKRLPKITKRPALSSKHSKQTINPKVAIFTGCLINYVYPEIYEATIKLLDKAGISYSTPKDQLCCGTPLLLYGDRKNAERIARHNIKVFNREKADAIITMCASCGRMLREEYSKLQSPVVDVVEFIDKHLIRNPQSEIHNLKTTYHQPCHFTWTKSGEITKQMLSRISDYRETDKDDLCCGGGGSFSFRHSELSEAIGQHKIELFKKANVNTIVTGCPGCIMQLKYLIQKTGQSGINVCHPVELLLSIDE